MSIVFPAPTTAYYIPDEVGHDDEDEETLLENSSQARSFRPKLPKAKHKCEETEKTCRRVLELRYEEVKPKTSKLALEDFVFTQKIDEHPVKGLEGLTWCVLTCKAPPDPDNESQSRYVAALDYAMLEGFDAIIIEPFDLGQRTQQWINVMTMVFNIVGAYFSITLASTFSSKLLDPAPTFVGIVNMIILKYYKKYAMGDPICLYRNLDFLNNTDMDKIFHTSELLDVRGAFTTVVMKDERRERFRYNILKFIVGLQIGLCTYKYGFALLLRATFPDRPI